MRINIGFANLQSGVGQVSSHQKLRGLRYFLPHSNWYIEKAKEEFEKRKTDLIGLCEIDETCFRSKNQLEIFNGNKKYARTLNFPLIAKMGNAVVSDYKILNSRVHQISGGLQKRNLIDCLIEKDGKMFDFCVTHLSPVRYPEDDEEVRKVAEILKRKKSFILAGDFNDEGNLLDQYFESSKDIKTFPSWNPISCLDRFYFSEDFKPIKIRTITEKFSDHLGIIGEFSY